MHDIETMVWTMRVFEMRMSDRVPSFTTSRRPTWPFGGASFGHWSPYAEISPIDEGRLAIPCNSSPRAVKACAMSKLPGARPSPCCYRRSLHSSAANLQCCQKYDLALSGCRSSSCVRRPHTRQPSPRIQDCCRPARPRGHASEHYTSTEDGDSWTSHHGQTRP